MWCVCFLFFFYLFFFKHTCIHTKTPLLPCLKQGRVRSKLTWKKKIVFLHIYMNKKSKRRIKWRACDFYEQSSMQCSSHQCSEAASTPKTVCACPIFMHDNNTLMKAQWDSIAQSLWELSVIKWLQNKTKNYYVQASILIFFFFLCDGGGICIQTCSHM